MEIASFQEQSMRIEGTKAPTIVIQDGKELKANIGMMAH
jgi:hypothetical protein